MLGIIILKVTVFWTPSMYTVSDNLKKRLRLIKIQIHKERIFVSEEKYMLLFAFHEKNIYVCIYMYVCIQNNRILTTKLER